MSPSTTVQPDPRAYVRIAAMVREMIASQVLPPGSPAPSITRLCASMAMPGRPADGRCACWRTKACCTTYRAPRLLRDMPRTLR